MRVFFSKNYNDNNESVEDSKVTKRFFYGGAAMMKSMGPDPRFLKVFAFNQSINHILSNVEEKVKKYLGKNYNFNFNSLEMKFYFGEDICNGMKDHMKLYFRRDCNKKPNYHNDCQFLDDGSQSKKDSARGDHSIVTVSFGS